MATKLEVLVNVADGGLWLLAGLRQCAQSSEYSDKKYALYSDGLPIQMDPDDYACEEIMRHVPDKLHEDLFQATLQATLQAIVATAPDENSKVQEELVGLVHKLRPDFLAAHRPQKTSDAFLVLKRAAESVLSV